MMSESLEIKGTEDWEELRAKFSKFLGLNKPVTTGVMRRAMVDSNFAHRLLISRNSQGFLEALMSDPKNRLYELHEDAATEAPQRSNLKLVGSMTKSLLRWSKAGFTHVDEEIYQQRTSTCKACPHLVEAPNNLVYKIRLTRKEDTKVCNLCGCIAARKARLSTETCPGAHPTQPGINRWGEPLRAKISEG